MIFSTAIAFATQHPSFLKFMGMHHTDPNRANKLTAAHRKLPFGTIITVKNLRNDKTVEVRVNDRGPFSKRLAIDLSESAAKQIGIYRKGVAKVEISYVLK